MIPYAGNIASFVSRNGSLPISARRSFKRVLSAIKTMTLLHQKHRRRDEQGRFISDYLDYAIVYQLLEESFGESLGDVKRYMDVADLEMAKRSGRAYLTVSGGKRLPTLFDLTGDPGWDKNGDLYAAYDLHLDGDAGDQAFYQSEETVSAQDVIIDDEHTVENDKPAVKVLSEKSHSEVLKMVEDFKKNQPAIDPNSVVSINLSYEFAEILTSDRYGLVN